MVTIPWPNVPRVSDSHKMAARRLSMTAPIVGALQVFNNTSTDSSSASTDWEFPKKVTRNTTNLPRTYVLVKNVHINIVVIGHFHSGKSTTAGHLIQNLGGMEDEVFKAEEDSRKKNKVSFKYSWILDKLKAERQRGITIDIALGRFETTKYYCTIIDAPGHRDFIRKMITGTAQADCALLIIDSSQAFDAGISKGGQTREHAFLAFALGVKQMICCCNKMDATVPKFSQARYETVVEKVSDCLEKVGFEPKSIPFVPISGYDGDNLVVRSPNLDWYKGPTLLEAIDLINVPKRLTKKPLRLPISEVYKVCDNVVVVGRVETGIVKPGMPLTFGPTGSTTIVKSVQMHGEDLEEGIAGDRVRLIVEGIVWQDIKSGFVASNSMEDPAKEAASFLARVDILNHGQISKGYIAVMDCHTSHITVQIESILCSFDKLSGKELEKEPKFLKNGEAGIVKILPTMPMVVEAFSQYPGLGRFILRDEEHAIAVGVIESVIKKY